MRVHLLLLLPGLILGVAACGGDSLLVLGDGASRSPGAGGSGGTGSGGALPGGGTAGIGGMVVGGTGPMSPDVPDCDAFEKRGHICHDGFCWMAPGQQGLDLAALHRSGDQVRAVGQFGTILLRTGNGWVREPSGIHADLLAIDGMAGELWVAGAEGAVLRRAPGGWTALPPPTDEPLHTVVARGKSEAWVASATGIFRWIGGGWNQVRRTDSGTIGIDRSGTLWATFDGALHRRRGERFERVAATTAILATHRFDAPLLLEPEAGRLYRWRNGVLHPLLDLPWLDVIRVEEGADGTLWLLVARSSVQGETLGHGIGHLDRTGLHWLWEEFWTHWHQARPAVRALIPSSSGFLAVGDEGRWVRGGPDGASTSSPEGHRMGAAIPVGEEELLAWKTVFPGVTTVFRWTSGGWTTHAPASFRSGTGLAGTSPNDVWASNHRSFIHWNGARTETFAAGRSYPTLLAIARDDVWAAGSHRVLAHWDGAEWQEIDFAEEVSLHGIWAGGPDDVLFVGSTILHWDGGSWSIPEGAPQPHEGIVLSSVSGTGSNDVWAAGAGALFHWDGTRWSRVAAPEEVERVWTAGGDAVFLFSVGESAASWKKAGDGWQRLPFDFHANLRGPPSHGTFVYGGQPGRFCREAKE